MINSDDLLKAFTPISSNLRSFSQLGKVDSEGGFSDRVSDYVSGADELETQQEEAETPLWKRTLRNSAVGAGLGGVLAAAKALPLTRSLDPRAAALGAAAGLVGSGGLTLARHMLKGNLRSRAKRRVSEADPSVQFVAKSPKTREMAHEWEQAGWAPAMGAEAAGLAGSLGSLAGAWALGKNPTGADAWKLSLGTGAATAVLGYLAGRWYKNKKQREFLEHTERELSAMQNPKAQEASIEAEAEQQPLLKAALSQESMDSILKLASNMYGRGGSPVCSTNAGLLRGRGGKVDQYVARKHGLVKLNQATIDMALDRAAGIYGLAEFCSDLEKLAEDAQSVQNSDPAGDGPTDPVWVREQAKGGAKVKEDVNKAPDGSTEPSKSVEGSTEASPSVKVSESKSKLRRRSEVIISNGKGILAIKEDGYLLMPGGGMKPGESPEEAVKRETSEEAGVRLKNLSHRPPAVEVLFNPENPCSPGFDGESSEFFLATADGKDGTEHKDREDFEFIPFDEAIEFLLECMGKKENAWAHANNSQRLFLITVQKDEANGTASEIDKAEHAFDKTADAVQLLPRQDALLFTPEGKLVVRKGKNRRFELPSGIEGLTSVPYESPVSFVPEGGVPEVGFHGHSVSLGTGTGQAPEGFEAIDPQDALKELYASLGHPKNRESQALDRARARAILRLMKSRTPVAPPV